MKQISTKVILASRKVHKCCMCLEDIPAGYMYFSHTFSENGNFETLKVCCICEYLILQTPDGTVKKGGFSERMIPNCLRKKRAEFIRNPKKFTERFLNDIKNICSDDSE